MAEDKKVESKKAKELSGGKTLIAEEVVATIACLAAEQTSGVVGMSGGITQGIAERLGRKSLTKGIKVEVGEKDAAADIKIIVTFGVKIHEVTKAVRENVKEAIETMTGLNVVEVNITVEGVVFETEKDDEKETTPPRVQ